MSELYRDLFAAQQAMIRWLEKEQDFIARANRALDALEEERERLGVAMKKKAKKSVKKDPVVLLEWESEGGGRCRAVEVKEYLYVEELYQDRAGRDSWRDVDVDPLLADLIRALQAGKTWIYPEGRKKTPDLGG